MLPEFVKNGVLIAIIAHRLVGASLVWDKVLLKKTGNEELGQLRVLAGRYQHFWTAAASIWIPVDLSAGWP